MFQQFDMNESCIFAKPYLQGGITYHCEKICISRAADKICCLLNLSQNPKWFLIILSAAKRQRRRQRTSRPTWMSWGSTAITCASSRIFVILMIESDDRKILMLLFIWTNIIAMEISSRKLYVLLCKWWHLKSRRYWYSCQTWWSCWPEWLRSWQCE